MEWTPIPTLIEQYRQQIEVIDQKVNDIWNQTGEARVGSHEDIEKLRSMRSSLTYSLYLMTQYTNNREK